MSCSKMNNFLHRMLNKSNCEEWENQKKSDATRAAFPKGNWIKKLGNYSPNKRQVPSSPRRTNTMKAVDKSSPGNPDAVTPRKTSSSPCTPLEMPDLESIIREFEMGFLSPTKNDSAADGCKQNNFVKKIVAAFEVKYNTYSDLKMAQETEESDEGGKADSREASKRKAWTFNSPFKATFEEPKSDTQSEDRSRSKQSQVKENRGGKSAYRSPLKENSEVCRRRSGVFVSPLENWSAETAEEERGKESSGRSRIFFSPSRDKREEDAKRRRSGIFSSPFNRRDCKDTSGSSEIYSSPVKLERQDSKDSSSDCSSLFKFDKEESLRGSDFHFAPLKISSLDDTKNIEDAELDMSLPEPEETISLRGSTLPRTSTRIDELANRNSNPRPEKLSTRIDKTPKIVGAFLKKPIEVEDTSIDWIPITGKKLPRKKSLKKLLYSLTGKKLERKSKLFSSERNLNEEPRELQDSGYDERSCSSSSLSSLVSVSEVLMQQENGYLQPERKASLRTFRYRNSIDEQQQQEEDEAFCERYRSASLPQRKQLLLTEVPRESVKLDLGPSYPCPKVVTMSLDRKTMSKKTRSPSPIYDRLPRLPKHPNLSKIPKHPFVSLTKMDDLRGSRGSSHAECPASQEPSIVVKNDLYEVEFRRSCDDLCSSASCRSSSSTTSTYDVPRRFLSKSENQISSLRKSDSEPIYDVPRPRSAERPKSSVLEEAVALKRRSVCLEKRIGCNVYAVPRDLELRCDVAKIGLHNNAAARSLNDFTCAETRSAF